jgi:hypothetical protein
VGAISLGSHQWGLAAVFPSRLEDALEKAGIKASAVKRIRLAKGVVGKASYVAASATARMAITRSEVCASGCSTYLYTVCLLPDWGALVFKSAPRTSVARGSRSHPVAST